MKNFLPSIRHSSKLMEGLTAGVGLMEFVDTIGFLGALIFGLPALGCFSEFGCELWSTLSLVFGHFRGFFQVNS